jgi:hypothetical protein
VGGSCFALGVVVEGLLVVDRMERVWYRVVGCFAPTPECSSGMQRGSE